MEGRAYERKAQVFRLCQVEDDGVNIGYEGIETEVVAEKDEGGLVAQRGGTDVGDKKYIRKPLTKQQPESYTQETN